MAVHFHGLHSSIDASVTFLLCFYLTNKTDNPSFTLWDIPFIHFSILRCIAVPSKHHFFEILPYSRNEFPPPTPLLFSPPKHWLQYQANLIPVSTPDRRSSFSVSAQPKPIRCYCHCNFSSNVAALTCFSIYCSVDTGPQATLGQTLRSGPGVKFVYKSLNFVASDSLCLRVWKFPHKGHYTIHKLQLSPSSERLKQVFLNSFHFTLVKRWKKN